MKEKRILLVFILLSLFTITVMAQNLSREITGVVTDDQGEPLPGATVTAVQPAGSRQISSVVTDVNGQFKLSFDKSVKAIEVTFVGFTTKRIAVIDRISDYKVRLESDSKNIDEVEVIGNGMYTRKAESFTGAAQVYSKDDLRRMGNTNVLQSLKNLDPSFQFAENLATGSNPNAMPNISLRGQSGFPDLRGEYSTNPNQPLFIVDGFETTLTKVMDMDMNRIKNVTILKDAAAKAIYGSKAANGVVVIETVKPEKGRLNVTYTGQVNVNFADLSSYNLANAAEKLEIERNAGIYNYTGYNGSHYWVDADRQYFYTQQYNNLLADVLRGYDTDWRAQPLLTGVGQKHTIYAEGGNDAFQYGIDLSYNDVEGVMKGSNRKTLSGGMTFSYHYKGLLFRNNLEVDYNKANNSPWGSFSSYTSMNPYFRPYDDHGNLIKSYTIFEGTPYETQITNPMWNASINTKNESKYTQITNNFYAEWHIYQDLKFTGRFALLHQDNRSEVFLPASHTDFNNYTTEELIDRRGRYTYSDGDNTRWSLDLHANYSHTWADKHLFFANLGWTVEDYTSNSATFVAEGFPNDHLSNIGYARAYLKDSAPTSSDNKTRDAGLVAAINYSYDNRYLLDASYRLSGSSQFGSNSRWGQFWSVGLGWNIHKEKFMKNAKWIDQLKLRGSMGYTGSQNFNSYMSMSTWQYYSSSFYNGNAGAYLMTMANPNLKWQKKNDKDVGFDFMGFNHRLSLRFDYYTAVTDDLLTDVTIAPSTGFNSYKANLGKVQNNGIEAYASYRVYQSSNRRDFVNLYASAYHNTNKIKEISNSLESYNEQQTSRASSRPVTKYEEGQSMTAIWAVPSLGIDPATGREIYVRKDGSTTFSWSSEDLAICGDTQADVYGNCGITASYKGWNFTLGMNYQFGGQLYNQTLVNKVENADLTYNVDRRVFTDRWVKPGDVSKYKNIADQSTTYATQRFVEDNNVWTFSSVNLSYDFDRFRIVRKWGFSRLRLSFDMSDIARISSIDTERGTSYPYAKSFSFSIQAIF